MRILRSLVLLLIVGLLTTWQSTVGANSLLDGEVFLDDPDLLPGAGTPMILNGEDTDALRIGEGLLDLTGVEPGSHTIYVRFKDADNVWSPPLGQSFYVTEGDPGSPLPRGQNQVVAAEAFIDDDPGEGSGVPLDIAADGAIDSAAEILGGTIPLDNLSIGVHVLHTRVLDSTGIWSSTNQQTFYVPTVMLPGASNPPILLAAEGIIDDGEPIPLPADDGAFDDVVETVTLTANVTDAYHSALIRFMDSQGLWSDTVSSCTGTDTLSGKLIDETTGDPLPNIVIRIDGLTVETDENGNYEIGGLPCGNHEVYVYVGGFVTFSQTVFGGGWFDILLTTDSTVSGLASNAGIASDPVNTATGNYVYQRRDLAIHGIGFPMQFDRTYNSREASSTAVGGPLGYGWSHSYHVRLSAIGNSIIITWGDGHTETFTLDEFGDYIPQYGVFDTLLDNGDGTFSLTKRNQTTYDFDTSGRLAAITDKNGNRLSLSYTSADLTEIVDTAGRVILLSYDTAGRIITITDPINRQVTYTYDLNGNLSQASDPNGNVTIYTYDASHQILTVVDPRGNTVVSNSYDAANRVVTYQTDAKGNATSFAYQELDRITTITDALGNITVHQHDALLRLIKEEDARGAIALYEYDSAGNRIAVTDKNGNRTQYGYDERGNVTSKVDALDNTITITYDEANNPLSRTDALNNVTQFEYDANGNLIRTTDALNHQLAISYLSNGLPETITDALNNVTTNAYDVEGNLTTLTDALGNTTLYTYDGVGWQLTVTDPNGHTTETTYDDNGNRLSVTDPLLGVISFTYDENDNKLSRTDRNRHTTEWAYDEKDLLISETDPLGQVERYAYDELDRRTSKTDRRGNTTAYTYDAVGNLIDVTNALNNTTRYSYDLNGNRLSLTDANDHTTSFTYDALNRRTQSIDALNNAIITGYDANGNRISRTDRRGYSRYYEYDALNRRIGVTNALGHSQAFGYDANGNRISQTNALGHTTTSSYDALNRLTATTDPLGHTQTSQYDPGGRVIAVIDANGQTTDFAYDARDRLTQVSDAAGGSVTYGYDANGNRTEMTDPNGNTTTYAYDALNRRISQTEPLGHVTSLAYDANGNLSQRTDPKGQVTNYVYGPVDRLTSIDYATQPDVGFTYDAIGNRLTLSDGLGTTSHSYDELDRRTATTDPFGQSVSYGYDANSNRTSLVYPDGKTVTYAYDGEDRMTNVTDWLGNLTTYSYDAANRLTGTLNANATTTEYAYDAANRLTGLANAKSDTSIINAYSYTLDPVGNHLSEERTEPLMPLIPTETLNDSHDAENRLIQRNDVTNGFDANGNLISKGTNTYVYDVENRLIETDIANIQTQYQYDGAGNRYARIRDGVTNRFVLDTNTELTNVLAETDASGNIQAYNVYGQGLIARIGTDDRTTQYHYDLRGSTIALTDGAQTVIEQYAYDPFGRMANTIGSESNPFGFLGKHGVLTEGDDLTYIRARYYDTEQKRFVNKDVKNGEKWRSQTLNRYMYAIGNPVRLVDVSGFSEADVIYKSPTLVTLETARDQGLETIGPCSADLESSVYGACVSAYADALGQPIGILKIIKATVGIAGSSVVCLKSLGTLCSGMMLQSAIQFPIMLTSGFLEIFGEENFASNLDTLDSIIGLIGFLSNPFPPLSSAPIEETVLYVSSATDIYLSYSDVLYSTTEKTVEAYVRGIHWYVDSINQIFQIKP